MSALTRSSGEEREAAQQEAAIDPCIHHAIPAVHSCTSTCDHADRQAGRQTCNTSFSIRVWAQADGGSSGSLRHDNLIAHACADTDVGVSIQLIGGPSSSLVAAGVQTFQNDGSYCRARALQRRRREKSICSMRSKMACMLDCAPTGEQWTTGLEMTCWLCQGRSSLGQIELCSSRYLLRDIRTAVRFDCTWKMM